MIRNVYHTSMDIDALTRAKLGQLLNQHLADTFDLFSQTRQVHWNAKSAHFYQFHRLFDRLAKDLAEHTDAIAERLGALGAVAKGTTRRCAADSRLPELPLELGDGQRTVTLLVERYAQLARTAREASAEAEKLGDTDTSNLLAGVSCDLDEALWFLEVHLRA
jgi:starvation-inducible DNA-binding protein